MGINISKPIDREYLRTNLEKLVGHTLYEMVEEEIIDVPEDYVLCSSTDPDALLVVDDSATIPGLTEVGISVVIDFIPTIQLGDYVQYIPPQTHKEDVMEEKYAHRLGEDMSDEDIEDLWDVTPEQLEVFRSLIQDSLITDHTLWSSDKTNSEIQQTVIKAKAYVDSLFGKSATVKIEIVTALPTEGNNGTLYILDDGTSFPIWIYSKESGGWIKTGADLNAIDLSAYVKKTQIVTDTEAGLMTPAYKQVLDNIIAQGVMYVDGGYEPLE